MAASNNRSLRPFKPCTTSADILQLSVIRGILSVCGSKKAIGPSMVIHQSCLSTAAKKKAARRLMYLPTTKKFDSFHPTQDSKASSTYSDSITNQVPIWKMAGQPCPVSPNPDSK